jgi:hypothetical protein
LHANLKSRSRAFVWHRQRELDDAENWAIFYTHHRDSGLLDQSNASIINKDAEAVHGRG